jgi:hypothetical protein
MPPQSEENRVTFHVDEFVESIRQCLLLQSDAGAKILVCPADPDDNVEYHLFREIHRAFKASGIRLPLIQLDGECVGNLKFDRDHSPDPALVGQDARSRYLAAWGEPWSKQCGFQAWSFARV